MQKREFQEMIWERGRELFRSMPWREDTQPYYVLVSEIMLQQTQVDRVIPKFNEFITAFPTVKELAQASLDQVLILWSGLGYNRRAKFLHSAARMIMEVFDGAIPSDPKKLMQLPGVGVNTAGAIATYSFNSAVPFIETNVRTVYFHHFFKDEVSVNDTELLKIVEETLDKEHPREWYWALMDYGSFLKRSGVSFNDKSRHYKKQSPLKGSVREVRGAIIRELTNGRVSIAKLRQEYLDDTRFDVAIEGLVRDGMIAKEGGYVALSQGGRLPER